MTTNIHKSTNRQSTLLNSKAHRVMKTLAFINGKKLNDAIDEAAWDWIRKMEKCRGTFKISAELVNRL